MLPKITESYNRYLNNRIGSASQKLEMYQNALREVELKINRTIDLLIDVGSASLKQKLSDLEKQKAGLEKDIAEQTKLLAENRVSEAELKCAFAEIRRSLTDGTLANAKQLVDTYIHDVVVYPDRIVVIFNLFPHIRITDKPPGKTNEEPSAEEGSFSVPDIVMFVLDREGKSEESGADILRRLRGESGVPP